MIDMYKYFLLIMEKIESIKLKFGISKYAEALSFNDVIMLPQFSDIESRLDVDLKTNISKNIQIDFPICSTNMSSITEFEMMREMSSLGCCGFLHRFLPLFDQVKIIQEARKQCVYPIIASVGIRNEDFYNVVDLVDAGANVILIDVAHGHSKGAIEILRYIKSSFSVDVIVGNVASRSGAYDLCANGADGIRVGIGGGSQCKTREVTGHGLPTLQSIIECSPICKKFGVPLIADGGIYKGSDIVKSLACGASAVCLGGLLSATSMTPGPIINDKDGKLYKEYYGMASKVAQDRFRGGIKDGTCPEGSYSLIAFKGPTDLVVKDLIGAIRSGLTYSGARNIKEFQNKVIVRRISTNSSIESKWIK